MCYECSKHQLPGSFGSCSDFDLPPARCFCFYSLDSFTASPNNQSVNNVTRPSILSSLFFPECVPLEEFAGEISICRGWLWHEKKFGGRCSRISVLSTGRIRQNLSSKTRNVGKLDQFLPYLQLRPQAPLLEIEQTRYIELLEDCHGKAFSNENNRLHQIRECWWATTEAWGKKSAKTSRTGVSSLKIAESWGRINFRRLTLLGKSTP